MKYKSKNCIFIKLIDRKKEKSLTEKIDSNYKTENVSFIPTKIKKKNFLKNSHEMDEKKGLNLDSYITFNKCLNLIKCIFKIFFTIYFNILLNILKSN